MPASKDRSPKLKSSGSDAAADAWQRAVRLLAARDRSEQELRTRLAASGATAAIIERTVRRLRDLHYLDDRRVAHGAAEQARRRGHGSERVRTELTAKGIAESIVEAALAEHFTDEIALARQALARRYPALPQSVTERAKAARFLLQRGFPEAVVLAILEEGC